MLDSKQVVGTRQRFSLPVPKQHYHMGERRQERRDQMEGYIGRGSGKVIVLYARWWWYTRGEEKKRKVVGAL